MKRHHSTVFSTELGRLCPRCGWPEKNCKCSSKTEGAVPDRIVAKLRIEKTGRKGKTVTIVYGLPRNQAFLKDLAKELKRACGAVDPSGRIPSRFRAIIEKNCATS